MHSTFGNFQIFNPLKLITIDPNIVSTFQRIRYYSLLFVILFIKDTFPLPSEDVLIYLSPSFPDLQLDQQAFIDLCKVIFNFFDCSMKSINIFGYYLQGSRHSTCNMFHIGDWTSMASSHRLRNLSTWSEWLKNHVAKASLLLFLIPLYRPVGGGQDCQAMGKCQSL